MGVFGLLGHGATGCLGDVIAEEQFTNDFRNPALPFAPAFPSPQCADSRSIAISPECFASIEPPCYVASAMGCVGFPRLVEMGFADTRGEEKMPFEDSSSPRIEPCRKPGAFGRFYLQELVNSGGMADIFLATDDAKQTRAMRLLRPTSFLDFATPSRFIRGCEILSQIHNHDYVIGYYSHGKAEGIHYCEMEYVEGANLKQLLFANDELLHQSVGNILIDMAIALEHVHDSGFMHLDFKPENVLVNRSGHVRLVDFDLAQPKPDKPQKQSKNPGTPAYMAPEQLKREGIDHRVDIFAFGVTAYELLTGQKPFPGDSADEILRRQLDSSVRSPEVINPALPPALCKLVMKCLDRDPDRRYPIMSVAVLELQNMLYVD